ncbi:MAG: efflux RND transporter periplasmic adaptor subunit [Dokdonella sp.]
MEKADLLNQLRIDRAEAPSRSRVPAFVGGVIALIALAVGVWWWLHRGPNFVVEVATAAAPSAGSAEPAAVLQATGYVTARRQATVSTQITGTLTDVLIEEGEHVNEGQVLAHLEDTAQQANLALARAQLAQAQASVGQFRAQLDQANRDLVRQQDLIARKIVSQQALENAHTLTKTLTAQLTAQQRAVDLAAAQVRGAQVQLDYTTVHAPFAGVVVAKSAQVGEIVSPLSAGGGFTRTGIGTIVDMDSLEIEVDVNESYINRVRGGGKAEAVLDAYPDWTIPAHVIAIIPTADRSKATVKVRIGLDQKDPRSLPDMGARVSFLDEPARNESAQGSDSAKPQLKGVMVPATAIAQRDGKSVVFALDGDSVHVQAITPGQAYGELRLIEGLPAGTRVVRAVPAEMNDGARVEIKK